jgi:hypothetical protein
LNAPSRSSPDAASGKTGAILAHLEKEGFASSARRRGLARAGLIFTPCTERPFYEAPCAS